MRTMPAMQTLGAGRRVSFGCELHGGYVAGWVHLQGADEEEADQVQALRRVCVQVPERGDRDAEDDEVGEETGAGDGVTGDVLVNAVAVGDALIPEVGERPAGEHDG